jgi:anti-sigma factor RsiW
MTLPGLVEEADLHALVDGELDPQRRRQVEDHLLQHPDDAALVETWRRRNAALRAAFEPVAHETPPPSLRGLAARGPAAPAGQGPIETGAVHWGRPSGSARPVRRLDEVRKFRRRQAIVSSLLTLLAGAAVAGAAILVFHGAAAPPNPRQDAAPAASAAQGYVARAGVTYFTYVSDARPVEIEANRRDELKSWLRARVGFALLPDLSGLGLRLLGGRVAPGVAAPAGLLFYENGQGARVGLYFERAEASAAAAPPPRAAPGLAAIEWRGAGMAFVLIGPLGAEAMQAAAERAAAEVAAREPNP